MFEHAMQRIEEGVRLLADDDLCVADPAEIGPEIKAIRCVIDRLEAQCARRVELFDRCRAYGPSGDTSTTGWLRNHCKMSGFSADRHLKFARQLPELQATRKALETGEIGIEHALEIARATGDLGAAVQGEMLSAAREQDPAELRQAAREIRHRVDAEGMERDAFEQHRKRRLRLFELADGMLGVEGALPAVGGVMLKLTLESLLGVPLKGDERTQEQRQADALLAACERLLDSGRLPSRNGRKPHLTVVIEKESARLEGAGPIAGETARRLLCGGSVSLLGVAAKGAALDLGRSRRLASEAQRRALVVRDRHCRWPGCDWEARFCEPHHLDQWALGGGTNVERMVLLCKVKHHPMVHEGGWRLVEREDGRVEAVPP